jgi:hypothetical protein
VKNDATPKLDERTDQSIVAEMLARLPGYLPGWASAAGSPGLALMQVFARYMHALIERLNQAPDKNELAFLDLLGINLLPAQAARAPMVFQAITEVGDSRVPARTRVGAKQAGQSEPLVFETERAIALATARLVEVVSLWPDRDAYADHSTAVARGESLTLFKPLKPIPHEFYIAHDILFSLVGNSLVELHFDLAGGGQSLAIDWEYWDGSRWQGFKAFSQKEQAGQSFDGTDGLSRSGTIRLKTECGDAVATKVNGVQNHWVRGRLNDPLLPQPGTNLPAVDRLWVRSLIERPIQKINNQCVSGIQPDQAFANGSKLDVSKTFYPLGRNADHNSAFYFGSEEVFTKPGAQVTLCLQRGKTPEEEADELEAQTREEAARKLILDALAKVAQAVIEAGKSIRSLAEPLLAIPNQAQTIINAVNDLSNKITDLENRKNDLQKKADIPQKTADITALGGAIDGVLNAISTLQPMIPDVLLAFIDLNAFRNLLTVAGDFTVKVTSQAQDTLDSMAKLAALLADEAHSPLLGAATWAAKTVSDAAWSLIILDLTNLSLIPGINEEAQLKTAIDDLTEVSAIKDLADIAQSVVKALGEGAQSILPGLDLFPDINTPDKLIDSLKTAATNAQAVVSPLSTIWGLPRAGTVGKADKALTPPRLLWEYWNGRTWKHLLGPINDDAANFMDSGEVHFTVPGDMSPTVVNNVNARWVRVRLAEGTYGRLRMVSWYDAISNRVNMMPIIEPRPPALEACFLGYTYRSPKTAPEYCFSYNDFQFIDQTREAIWPGPPLKPFSPTADSTPSLYLGFDRALPADLISLFFNVEEQTDQVSGPPLKWEYHDGEQWLTLSVEDETANLALPGMVAATWPGVEAGLSAAVIRASGTEVQLGDARQAARFAPGSLFYITESGDGELIEVISITRDNLRLKAPLTRDYGRATISQAALPRFGTPRTWIRARLENAGEPLRSELHGIHPNAVWAAQIQTVENEMLGSSSAQAAQVLFFRHTPVLEGETIEVLELEGPRAAVELPLFREAILRDGLTDRDLRVVTDRRSGQPSEVWVRWRVRDNLFFSGPGDRDVVIERTRGRLLFGDNLHGRIVPAGNDNIRALLYRSGGGVAGNVPAGAISQLLSGVPAQSVSNPRAAEGGADNESVDSVLKRGPQAVRHRRQALSRGDYEVLAREASPAVAAARALPGTHPNGLPAPGWVTLVIVPESIDPQPQPSFELRRRVKDYLQARCPASLSGLAIIGPTYLPIGVEAVIAPLSPSEAGPVGERVHQAMVHFLHPLTGGPEGTGWPFGRGVYLSDVAAILESIEGVDYVETINLLLDGTPQGEVITVPADRIVVAGPVQIKLR